MGKRMVAIALLFLLTAISAQAASGDVVGHIYSTDILAVVNGKPIPSYSIGGKTAIAVEDLYLKESGDLNYGFDWEYDNAKRMLTVETDGCTGYGYKTVERGTVGQILGNVYESDIQLIFNGIPVTSYSIDGKTAVCIEDLGTVYPDSANAQYGYSEYLCNFRWDPEKRLVELNTYQNTKYNYFNSYPDHKLRFVLQDNILFCTFDQTNPYRCTLETDFSEAFANDINKIKPVYMNGEMVGNMYVGSDGKLFFQMDDVKMYAQTKDLAVILSYEEAKQYINTHFEIIDSLENALATVYLARKDDARYQLFALKNGGFVIGCVFPDETDKELTIAFKNIENGETVLDCYPVAGTPGSQPGHNYYPCSAAEYDFHRVYDCYIGALLPPETTQTCLVGTANVMIDGKAYTVSAMQMGEYNNDIFVDADEIAKSLGLSYVFRNGDFVYETTGEKHEISVSFMEGKKPLGINELSIGHVFVNGGETKVPFVPYLYQLQAYIPFSFIENLYK